MRCAWVWMFAIGCGRIGFDDHTSSGDNGDAPNSGGDGTSVTLPDPIHHWALDEAPGASIAVDSRGANATVMPPATFVDSGRFGRAFEGEPGGDSSGAWGTATIEAAPADILGRSQLTMTMWFRVLTSGDYAQLGCESTGDELSMSAAFGAVFFCIDGPGHVSCESPPYPEDGQWHFSAMTFDGTQSDATKRMRGYIDGVVATTGHAVPATTTTTALPFIIGDWTTSGLADSLLDDVRIYDSTLTAAQIAALFAGT